MKIDFTQCKPGVADFEFAGDEKHLYQFIFSKYPCTGNKENEPYHCKRRTSDKELKI